MSVSKLTSTSPSSSPIAPVEAYAHQRPDIKITTAEVEASFDLLLTKLTFTTPLVLDYADEFFKTHFQHLIMSLKSQTASHCQQWENPDLIDQTRSIMIRCQGLLYQIDGILDDQTQHLNPQARLQKKAELLKDENFDHHLAFNEAFDIFIKAYNLIRSKAFTLSLPNIQNYPKGKFESAPLLGDLSHEYCVRFMKGNSPQRELNILFNETQEKLADLLKAAYPDSPHLIKDEQPIPGDYNNPGNPFWIYPRAPVK